jgi:CubicO group peptidase (beta-lactamase class C family)
MNDMKRNRRYLVIVAVVAAVGLVRTQSLSPQTAARVDGAVQDALQAFRVPGTAIAIVKDDEVVYLKGVGQKDVDTGQAVTADTIFAIGSTTKAFTTTAMAMLVDEGRLGWEDPVRKHLPWFRLADPLADQQVTLRDIVSHRTGLSRHDMLWYNSPYDRDDIIRRIGLVAPTASFRSGYLYQNVMFLTAGQVVAAASNSGRWEEAIQQRILEPLGMTATNFSITAAEQAADHATPYRKTKDGKIERLPWRNVDNIAPAGAINSNVRDLSRWVRFQLAGGSIDGRRLVSESALNETRMPNTVIRLEKVLGGRHPEANLMAYGMAWTLRDHKGHLLVEHGGNIDGFSALIGLAPKDNTGIVILTNLNSTLMPYALANTLFEMLLDLPRSRDWNSHMLGEMKKAQDESAAKVNDRQRTRVAGTKPSRELAAYAGTYEHAAYGRTTVSVVDGALTVSWNAWTIPLTHFHFDTFGTTVEHFENDPITFVLGADGDVKSMTFLDAEFVRAIKKQ